MLSHSTPFFPCSLLCPLSSHWLSLMLAEIITSHYKGIDCVSLVNMLIKYFIRYIYRLNHAFYAAGNHQGKLTNVEMLWLLKVYTSKFGAVQVGWNALNYLRILESEFVIWALLKQLLHKSLLTLDLWGIFTIRMLLKSNPNLSQSCLLSICFFVINIKFCHGYYEIMSSIKTYNAMTVGYIDGHHMLQYP